MANANTQRNRPIFNETAEAARRATLQSLGISRREERVYSLSRALVALADGRLGGYEAECSQQLVNNGHAIRSNNGFLVPSGLPLMVRDLTAGTPSAGGYLVGTQNVSFIDLLRSKLIVAAMGATILPGLRENVTIPKLTAGATAAWLTNESTAISESTQTLDQLSLSPKNVGAYTEVSRQLLLQSSPAVDVMVGNDLAQVVARAIDAAAIAGSGSGGQPTGLMNVAGVGAVTGTSLAYAGVLEFATDVIGANASINPATTGFVTTPTVAALLMARQKVAATYSPIWEGNVGEGRVDGMKAMSSTGCPSATAVFGDWSSLILGEWGSLEIATNPFANFTNGVIGIRAIQSVDVGVRYAQSFSVATSIT